MDIGKVFSALLYFIAAIVEVLLIFRFALLLFAANEGAEFTQFVYSSTEPFVSPFLGVFPELNIAFIEVELGTILAIIVYAVATIVFVQLIKAFEGFVVRPSGPKGGAIQNPMMNMNQNSQPPMQQPPMQPNMPINQQPMANTPYPHNQQPMHNPQNQDFNNYNQQGQMQNNNTGNQNYPYNQDNMNSNFGSNEQMPSQSSEQNQNNDQNFTPYPHNQAPVEEKREY